MFRLRCAGSLGVTRCDITSFRGEAFRGEGDFTSFVIGRARTGDFVSGRDSDEGRFLLLPSEGWLFILASFSPVSPDVSFSAEGNPDSLLAPLGERGSLMATGAGTFLLYSSSIILQATKLA